METVIFFVLILLLGVFKYYKHTESPKIKGSVGEFKVALILKRLHRRKYIVINDLLIENNGHTTQLDHVVICESGLIVIETKNYKGWIHGHENAELWSQTIYKKKYKLTNPVKQNWAHVYALKRILFDFKTVKYYPIIVFAGDGKLKNITATIPVIKITHLLKTIKSFNNAKELSWDEMQAIASRLEQKNCKERKTTKEHINKIKAQEKRRADFKKKKICPRCEKKLVLRKGKYGKFYGCQNFPTCRYTLKY
ncbi:MAG: NERD domain-containing protein [Bacteroidota bacterium]|nr:NERD domain-containing protein [Bacteroidota bacterium]